MRTLTITRGLPGSGKTTWALQWLAVGNAARLSRARVNRDDLRAGMFNRHGVLSQDEEDTITRVQRDAVTAHLRAGRDVVVDDMHLRASYVRQWQDIAAAAGAGFVVRTFETPIEECVARDAARNRVVGEDVIRGLAARYHIAPDGRLPKVTLDAPKTADVYVPQPGLPPVWLVDLDGTLAIHQDRGPFEWHRVSEDALDEAVALVVRGIPDQTVGGLSCRVVYMSGRDDVCRADTQAWLDSHDLPWGPLFMRPAGDMRKDSIVKRELFDAHIRHRFDVIGVLDDRAQVVRMWRDLGLKVFAVADGDF